MSILFVTATNTAVGKTVAATRLIRAISTLGISPGVCKPLETGVRDTPPDAKILLDTCKEFNNNYSKFTPFDITAYTFTLPAAPFCADISGSIEIEKILNLIEHQASLCDILVVEGAGGVMVPITKEYYIADLISDIDAHTLLVSHSGLGCINDTLLSMEMLSSKGLDFSWCINLYRDTESFDTVSKPFFDANFPNWWTLQSGLESFVKRFADKNIIYS